VQGIKQLRQRRHRGDTGDTKHRRNRTGCYIINPELAVIVYLGDFTEHSLTCSSPAGCISQNMGEHQRIMTRLRKMKQQCEKIIQGCSV